MVVRDIINIHWALIYMGTSVDFSAFPMSYALWMRVNKERKDSESAMVLKYLICAI